MTDRSLRVRPRVEPAAGDSSASDWNLFARLAPLVARELHLSAAQGSKIVKSGQGWYISAADSPDCRSGVEFLPLSLKLSSGETIFVSYNGGDVSSENEDCIELPACFLPPHCTSVVVSVLPTVVDAKELVVEPLSYDDWLLLDSNASWLEAGGLLRQICLVYPNQIIPLTVNGRDVARMRVRESNFRPPTDEIWPSAEEGFSCLRLVARTSVVVLPQTAEPRVDPLLRVIPVNDDFDKPMQELVRRLGAPPLSVLPNCGAVNPKVLQSLKGWVDDGQAVIAVVRTMSDDVKYQRSAIIHVSACASVKEACIALHPSVRFSINCVPFVDEVVLRILEPIEVARSLKCAKTIVSGKHERIRLETVDYTKYYDNKPWRQPFQKPQQWQLALFKPEPLHEGLIVEVGGILPSNWALSRPTGRLLRLVIDGQDQQVRSDLVGKFVLMRDLVLLIKDWQCESLLSNYDGDEFSSSDLTSQESPPRLPSILWDGLSSSCTLLSSCTWLLENTKPISSILVCGEKRSGKTQASLLAAACSRVRQNYGTVYFDCRKVKETRGARLRDILDELREAFEDAAAASPCVLILDDVDELTPAFDNESASGSSAQTHMVNPAAVDQAKAIADTVKYLWHAASNGTARIELIATCQNKESLHSSVRSAIQFDRAFDIPALSRSDRILLFWSLLKAEMGVLDRSAFDEVAFSKKTDGWRVGDVVRLAHRVRHRLHSASASTELLSSAVNQELTAFVPLGQLSTAIDETASTLAWNEVGGLFTAKEDLTSIILRPSRYALIYQSSPIKLPRGVLLFGPPGCGKSILPAALAKQCGFALITCRGPEILDRYIGASEAKVRELFGRAAVAAPSILFLDELDSLAPKRGSDQTGVTDRVVNQLLTFLDGVENVASTGPVYVIGATSRPDKVDPALLRPGRLEKHVYVGNAETPGERIDLLLKLAGRYSVDSAVVDAITTGELIRELDLEPQRYVNMSAADYKGAFSSAHLMAVGEILANGGSQSHVVIRLAQLMDVLKGCKASLPPSDVLSLQRVYYEYRKDESEGSAADAASGAARCRHPSQLRVALR